MRTELLGRDDRTGELVANPLGLLQNPVLLSATTISILVAVVVAFFVVRRALDELQAGSGSQMARAEQKKRYEAVLNRLRTPDLLAEQSTPRSKSHHFGGAPEAFSLPSARLKT